MRRLHPDRQGEIVAILNAIECHIEEGRGDPDIVRCLADALLAMTAIVHVDARTMATIARHLDRLHDHVCRRTD